MGKPDLLTAVDAIYASVLTPERWAEALNHIALPFRRARRGYRASHGIGPDGNHRLLQPGRGHSGLQQRLVAL